MASNPLHGDQTSDDGVHIIYAFEYADTAARMSASGLVAADIGKVARQLDDTTFWVLTDDSGPVWSSMTFDAPVALVSFTVLGVPSASPPGQMIYVSNETGGAVPAFSDGTDWRRVTDRMVVS